MPGTGSTAQVTAITPLVNVSLEISSSYRHTALSADDSATGVAFEDCAGAVPGIMAGARCDSTLKIRPGCPRRIRLPARTGQPLIAGMASSLSKRGSLLPPHARKLL